MKKREEFSVSLRKKKKDEIIQTKRKRALNYRKFGDGSSSGTSFENHN